MMTCIICFLAGAVVAQGAVFVLVLKLFWIAGEG